MPAIRVNALSFAILVRAMYDGPKSLHQLAEITGLHLWTCRHYVKALQKQEMAYITRWDKDTMGRDATPYYTLGMGVSMPRSSKTGGRRQRELRARQRAAIAETHAA